MSHSSPAQVRPWTQADMNTLTALSERGVSSKLIALLLSRSVRAVSAKRRALSLPAFVEPTADQLHTDAWLPAEVDILRKVVQAHRAESSYPLTLNRLKSVAQGLCRPFPSVLSALRDLGFSDCLPSSVLPLIPGVSADQLPTPEPEQQAPEPEQQTPEPEQQTPAPTAPVPPPANLEPFMPPAHSSVPPMMTSSAPTRVRLKPPVSHGDGKSEFERLSPGSKEVIITSPVTGISRTHRIPAPETPTVPGSETPSVPAPVTDSTSPAVTASEPTDVPAPESTETHSVVFDVVKSLITSGVTIETVAKTAGISVDTVESLCREYGFKPIAGVNTERWSVYEIAYLIRQLDGVSSVEFYQVEVFAHELNRHVDSIVEKLQQLDVEVNRVSTLKDSDYALLSEFVNLGWSSAGCAQFFNVPEDVILKTIKECTVPARLVPWSEEEISTLKGIFGNATQSDLTSALPLRPLPAILSKAESLNL